MPSVPRLHGRWRQYVFSALHILRGCNPHSRRKAQVCTPVFERSLLYVVTDRLRNCGRGNYRACNYCSSASAVALLVDRNGLKPIRKQELSVNIIHHAPRFLSCQPLKQHAFGFSRVVRFFVFLNLGECQLGYPLH